MFTGIIECIAEIKDIRKEGSNKHFTVAATLIKELKIDQSVSHNGVCLTVVEVEPETYTVTAIDETLQKTNLNDLKIGSFLNLERCMKMNGRLDGHIVQGHVDQTAICKSINEQQGSWLIEFEYDTVYNNITVEKGSICIDGISLTVVNSEKGTFSVAIIPYTFNNTNMQFLREGGRVNLEFDIIGKYVARLLTKH